MRLLAGQQNQAEQQQPQQEGQLERQQEGQGEGQQQEQQGQQQEGQGDGSQQQQELDGLAFPELTDLASLQALLAQFLAHSGGPSGAAAGRGGAAAAPAAGLGSMTPEALMEELQVMMAS